MTVNEYARAGILDPKIDITMSRDPSSKLLQFAKVKLSDLPLLLHSMYFLQEMQLVFPNSHHINHSTFVVKELATACHANDITDLIILQEHHGTPDTLIISHFPHGPTLYFMLHNMWPCGLLERAQVKLHEQAQVGAGHTVHPPTVGSADTDTDVHVWAARGTSS